MIALALSSCSAIRSPTKPTADPGNPGAPRLDVLTLEYTYPVAYNEAKDWREDAFLSWVEFDVVPLSNDGPPGSTLSFLSASNPEDYLLVSLVPNEGGLTLGRVSHGRFEDPRAYRPNAEAIYPNDPNMQTYEALSLALEFGAADFIKSQRPIEWPAELNLEREDPAERSGPLRWIATFKSSSRILHLFIDDQSGDLIEERMFTR